MKRIFISIPLPQTIRSLLHAMGRSIQGARPVPEDQIHLTLRFIGEVEGTLFRNVMEELHQVSGPPFTLSVQGVGHFPPRGKPRVVWVGLKQCDQLIQLKKKVDTALNHCGLSPDERKFSPHVTIARINTTSTQRLTEFLSGNAFLAFDEFPVNSFRLYSSVLSHKGAVHTLEENYTLLSR